MCVTVGSLFPSFVSVGFFIEHEEHLSSMSDIGYPSLHLRLAALISYSQWLVHPNQTQTHHPHIQTCTVLFLSIALALRQLPQFHESDIGYHSLHLRLTALISYIQWFVQPKHIIHISKHAQFCFFL
eukprot:494668_1